MQAELKELLKSKGLKVTNQRVIILDTLSRVRGQHLTMEEIYDIVKKDSPEIGLATIYRSIQLLCQLGLVNRIVLNDGINRYEIADKSERHNKHHHHHLVCVNCGKVIEFEDDLLEVLEETIKLKMHFITVNHEVNFFGYCSDCKSSTVI